MENTLTMSRKPYEQMTADEKIQDLKWKSDELMSRTAKHNDQLALLSNEIQFWRKMFAIKEGLTNEQMDKLFGYTQALSGLAGINRY